VASVLSEHSETVPGSSVPSVHQELRVELLDGEREGQTLTVENDYRPLKAGQAFFLRYLITEDGQEIYTVGDPDRRAGLGFLAFVFAAVIVWFGGKQGFRSLLSLAASFFILTYALIPSLMKGYPPVLTSSAFAAAILGFAIFATHGRTRTSAIAFSGTALAVILTSVLSYLSVHLLGLTGFGSEEAVYLNLATGGTLDFSGLLLGGIIIGVLGVLDDIAVTQVAVVEELKASDPNLPRAAVYRRALRVGREHVAALVNTLALAYAGASLPLLLLLSTSTVPMSVLVNQEMFAAEIVRVIVGSIGLVLTVPITTAIAVFYAKPSVHEGHGHHSH
jgi:uncharacterized membrane protein